MSRNKNRQETSCPWWKTRAAAIGAFAIVFAGVIVAYAGAATIDILFHLLIDGAFLCVWLLGALGMGWLISRAARLDLQPPALQTVVSIALGLGCFSLLTLVLGLAGWLNHWTSIAL